MTEGETNPLKFKPLTRGLGFQPSPSPAAPQALPKKNNSPMRGTGAEVAGTPKFIAPQPQVYKRTTAPTPTFETTQKISASIQVHYGFDYLLKRFFAYVLDFIFNISMCLIALSLAAIQAQLDPKTFESADHLLWVGGFILFFHWALLTAEEVAFHSSIGKKIFGLELIGDPFRVLFRSLAFIVSVGFGGIGLIWSVFHPNKQTLHDLLSELQPTESQN